MNDLKVCWWAIDKPIAYSRNSRKIPERAIDKVAASMLGDVLWPNRISRRSFVVRNEYLGCMRFPAEYLDVLRLRLQTLRRLAREENSPPLADDRELLLMPVTAS